MDSSLTRKLVFGASGYIGTNLTEYLVGRGERVRASSRNLDVLEGRGWEGAELCEADALQPETLDAALRGVETAYYLVHSMGAGGEFPELDARAARNFAEAAARQGVRRIVYLGGLMPDVPKSAHLRSRQETGDILREGRVPVTELRAGMIIGPGSAAWEIIRDLVNYLPVMVTPRWVKSRSTPIALRNLLYYLAEVPRVAESAGETYDVAGPETLTYVDIMRRYAALVGKNPFIIPVPVLTPRLSSRWLRLVTSVPTSIGRALIDGLSQDVIGDDARIRALLPQRLLDFDEAAKEAMNADRQHDLPARWVEGAIHRGNFKPRYGFYAKQELGLAETIASKEALWEVVCEFGLGGDFFFARPLWWLRRSFDWVVGGPSFRRRRRHPSQLRVGDVVDSWRVIAMQPCHRLALLMEMKAPGSGVLEFTIHDHGNRREVEMHVYWHPAGIWGLLYWYSTLPAHAMLFTYSPRNIARRAEKLEQAR